MAQHKKSTPHDVTLSTGASFGGTVSRYREEQNIYLQGSTARSLFFIQEGGVRISRTTHDRRPAVTSILSEGDFFGTQCLVGFPIRLSSAVAMTSCSVRSIPQNKMIDLLHAKGKASVSLVNYLLVSINNYQEHVAALLTFTAKERLARILLSLAHLDKKGPGVAEVPNPNHQVLADMVGTTRSRINVFMNDFRRRGYISYDGGLEVHRSLRTVLRNN